MGMSIDEAINGVEKRILPIFDNDEDHEALEIALDTMRKYQKIIDAMLMNDMVENIYFAIEEILKDDLEQDERFGK